FVTIKCSRTLLVSLSFFLTDPLPSEIYTLSLHDALPIFGARHVRAGAGRRPAARAAGPPSAQLPVHQPRPESGPRDEQVAELMADRKSTRLNSSHEWISYAVFCLKKKKNKQNELQHVIPI